MTMCECILHKFWLGTLVHKTGLIEMTLKLYEVDELS